MDTDVLSAGAPGRRERTAGLVRWMEAGSRALFLSTVTAAEISGGIAELKRAGSVSGAVRLEEWLALVLHLCGGRVLPFDVPAARLAGELMDKARATGQGRKRLVGSRWPGIAGAAPKAPGLEDREP